MTEPAKLAAVRGFIRSFNILQKYVRLFGAQHQRSQGQSEIAWKELQQALAQGPICVGVCGTRLMLDGSPLEPGPAERSFAQLVAAAGIGSIHFGTAIKREELNSLATGFAHAKPEELMERLKATLGANAHAGIRVNAVRFVTDDTPAAPRASVVAQVAAAALGSNLKQFEAWLEDPRKLLQAITMANAGPAGVGATTQGVPVPELQESDVIAMIRWLASVARSSAQRAATAVPDQGAEAPQPLPSDLKSQLQRALGAIAELAETDADDAHVLIKVAEELAVRYALEKFERGEIGAGGVRGLLTGMERELSELQKLLASHEEVLGRAGLLTESRADLLDRQFWARVPESTKRNVLCSPDAWCIPPRNVRGFVETLLNRNQDKLAKEVLRTFVAALESPEPEAKDKVGRGLSELADLLTRAGLLPDAVQRVAQGVLREPQCGAVADALVALAEEAASQRCYGALSQVFDGVTALERQDVLAANRLRGRIALESRLHDFVAEAVRAAELPAQFVEVLRHAPGAATEELAQEFARSARQHECVQIVEIARGLGDAAIQHLNQLLRTHSPPEAVASVGLLSRLQPAALAEEFMRLVPAWNRVIQDAALRQLACGESKARAQLLSQCLEIFDPLLLPAVVDELGMTGYRAVTAKLLLIAEGQWQRSSSPYLRLKAVEALGRLHDAAAVPLLSSILTGKGLLGWQNPRELRIAAAQALRLIDAERARGLLSCSGLSREELQLGPLTPDDGAPWVRQRRYARTSPGALMMASLTSKAGNCRVALERISLGGGAGTCMGGQVGSEATFELPIGFRSLRAPVMMRPAPARKVSFEILEMELEDRSRLRRVLMQQTQAASAARA